MIKTSSNITELHQNFKVEYLPDQIKKIQLIQSLEQILPLRPYQIACLKSIKEKSDRGVKRQLISLPTGAGKTVVFANLIKETGVRTLVIAHTEELLQQAKDKIQMISPGLEVGLVNADHKQFDSQVVVASIQAASLPANLVKLIAQNFGLLVFDEAHHAATENARKVLTDLGFGKHTSKLLVGFSATAFRNDERGLRETFDEITFEKNTKELINEGWLVKPKGFKVATDLDLSAIKTVDGDLQTATLAEIMNTSIMNNLVVDAFAQHAFGKKAIAFTVNIEHANDLADAFNAKGIKAKVIFGQMPKDVRQQILIEFKNGQIDVLCNCQVLTEGFDDPSIECVIIARPTKSKGLYQQMVGRGLRPWPNKKECIVIDFNDRNHSICNAASLLLDGEPKEEKNREEKKQEQLKLIPKKLNPKLRSVLLNYDPLGESFNWKHEDRNYILKGNNGVILEVSPCRKDDYMVVLITPARDSVLAKNLSFEFAFSTAEDFAKANKKFFIFSDKNAEWRNKPISDDQSKIIKSHGYKKGISDLTRGQASIIIGSGVLSRKN